MIAGHRRLTRELPFRSRRSGIDWSDNAGCAGFPYFRGQIRLCELLFRYSRSRETLGRQSYCALPVVLHFTGRVACWLSEGIGFAAESTVLYRGNAPPRAKHSLGGSRCAVAVRANVGMLEPRVFCLVRHRWLQSLKCIESPQCLGGDCELTVELRWRNCGGFRAAVDPARQYHGMSL